MGDGRPGRQIRPQVKICGLTRPREAAACARLGADAIGCIFYPPSPRNIDRLQAVRIREALPDRIALVGVFVDECFDEIRKTVEKCGLSAVQLHGKEPPELIFRLTESGIRVIKALFASRPPGLQAAIRYRPDAFLVEAGRGILPGGNAWTWDWSQAKSRTWDLPLILAGGLDPENIHIAVAACTPDAVDVSSGVESSPGIKDLDKVAALMDRLPACLSPDTARRIFP